LDFSRAQLPLEKGLIDYVGWNDWVIAHAFVTEAKALIEGR